MPRSLKNIGVTMLIALLCSCNRPVQNLSELNGCYYGAGEKSLFSISNGVLRSPDMEVFSTVSIDRNQSDTSILHFAPGIRFTDTVHKTTVIARGDENFGLAYKRGSSIHIISSAFSDAPLDVVKRPCTRQ
jgi:hypothetical protein